MRHLALLTTAALLLAVATAGCSGSASEANNGHGRGGPSKDGEKSRRPAAGGEPGGMAAWGGGEPEVAAAVPVEVTPVVRQDISAFIETNGTLEAENEVDLVARLAAPVVELLVEEGMEVARGDLLARLDDEEIRADLEISRVSLKEAELAFQRALQLQEEALISPEAYEQAQSRFDTARAALEGNEILLGYTEIRAPFGAVIVNRYVDFAEQVAIGTRLFRISNFDPLLCPVQVPERELSRLRLGQPAYLTVEPWPGERFEAEVLRLSPVINAATGTLKVTLEVEARNRLRPGMFARIFVETETRPDALVIPRAALSLESIGDTVYVAEDDAASRRDVRLGFQEGDLVEVLSGLSENESVVVVGQDGLSDGTPIRILDPAKDAVTPR